MVDHRAGRKTSSGDPAQAAPQSPAQSPVQSDLSNDDRLDLLFHALADRSRRRILQLLRQAGRLRVGDLAAAFSMSLNGVSKHLKVLEKAGLVQRTVQGREHWLSPLPQSLDLGRRYFDLAEQYWADRLDAFSQALVESSPQISDDAAFASSEQHSNSSRQPTKYEQHSNSSRQPTKYERHSNSSRQPTKKEPNHDR